MSVGCTRIVVELGRECCTYGGEKSGYKILVGKCVRKRQFGSLDVDGKIVLKL
jgi:hypothetical protein